MKNSRRTLLLPVLLAGMLQFSSMQDVRAQDVRVQAAQPAAASAGQSGVSSAPLKSDNQRSNVSELSLQQVIELACTNSLSALRAKNSFLTEYWAYRSYRAARLPSLSLKMTPLSYERTFTSRYNSATNQDEYRRQQTLYSYGNLQVAQNFDATGGTFYMNSMLSYIRNFGNTANQQFSTVPFRLGYSQELIGYNAIKWEKRIEPIKYEKAKRSLLYSMEEVSEAAAGYYFDLLMAQVALDLARNTLSASDTLYRIGTARQEIASISQADLLTLKLDWINAGNEFRNAEIDLKKAAFRLQNFLKLDAGDVHLLLPEKPGNLLIPGDKALTCLHLYNPDLLSNRQSLLEAEQSLEQTERSSRFKANLDMSFGFNQVASKFVDSYRDPLEQDVVSVSINVPLVDWGVRKGKVNMAKNKLKVTQLTVQQSELSLEEDVTRTVSDFNIQQSLISSAEEAQSLADLAFDATKERYLIGKADMNSLTLARNRQESARRNYVSALKNYWLNYLKIRKITLYDYLGQKPLFIDFESRYGIH